MVFTSVACSGLSNAGFELVVKRQQVTATHLTPDIIPLGSVCDQRTGEKFTKRDRATPETAIGVGTRLYRYSEVEELEGSFKQRSERRAATLRFRPQSRKHDHAQRCKLKLQHHHRAAVTTGGAAARAGRDSSSRLRGRRAIGAAQRARSLASHPLARHHCSLFPRGAAARRPRRADRQPVPRGSGPQQPMGVQADPRRRAERRLNTAQGTPRARMTARPLANASKDTRCASGTLRPGMQPTIRMAGTRRCAIFCCRE